MISFRRLVVLVLGTLAGLIVLVGVGYLIFTDMFLTVPKNINVGIQFIPDKLNNEELSKEYVAMRLDTEENLGCYFPNELKVSTSFHRDTAQVKIKGYIDERKRSSVDDEGWSCMAVTRPYQEIEFPSNWLEKKEKTITFLIDGEVETIGVWSEGRAVHLRSLQTKRMKVERSVYTRP